MRGQDSKRLNDSPKPALISGWVSMALTSTNKTLESTFQALLHADMDAIGDR